MENVDLLGKMSHPAQNILVQVSTLGRSVDATVANSAAGAPPNWSGNPKLSGLLRQIDSYQNDKFTVRHGPDVLPEEALQTGILAYMKVGAGTALITLTEALDYMSKGDPVLIGGAGSSIADFLEDAAALGHTVMAEGLEGVVLQYVGLDLTHWKSSEQLPEVAGKLELNLLKTAVLELVNAALNANKRSSLIISYGFGAWVVNRALQTLPPEDMPFARNVQIDGFGPEEAMKELVAAKTGLYGKICSIQTNWAANNLGLLFQVTPDNAKKMPVDISV